MNKPIKELELSFTHLAFYDSVVISTVKEDLIIEKSHIEKLREICSEQFGKKGFVYITNRKYNYNVNPVIYINLIKTSNLKGIAVVSEDIGRLQTANFEKSFSPVPYELFHNKEEAIVWGQSMVLAN